MLTPTEKAPLNGAQAADLVSLLGMLKTYAKSFVELGAWLVRVQQELEENPDEIICLEKRDRAGFSLLSESAYNVLDFAGRCAELLDLEEVKDQIRDTFEASSGLESLVSPKDFYAREMATRLKVLQELFWRALWKRKLLYVKRPELYEAEPWDSAPRDARDDVKHAGECLALGLPDACVFHLMRVAETGLRTLAALLGVVSVQRGKPIDLAGWKQIFDAIDKELDKLKSSPRSTAQDESLERYSALRIELRAFQDAYRDRSMHARVSYDEHQAESIYNHVRAFAERLYKKPPTPAPQSWIN